jgi:hypothetical protein
MLVELMPVIFPSAANIGPCERSGTRLPELVDDANQGSHRKPP